MTSLTPASNPAEIGQERSPCASSASVRMEAPGNLPIHLLLDTLPNAALLVRGGRIAYANAAAFSFLQTDASILIGSSLTALFQFHSERLADSVPETFAPGEYHAMRLGRESKPVVLRCQSLGEEQQRDAYLVIVRELEREAAHAAAQVSMEVLPWAMMRIDGTLRYLHGNTALDRLSTDLPPLRRGHTLRETGWPDAFCRDLETALSQMADKSRMQRMQQIQQLHSPRKKGWKALPFTAELIPETDSHGKLSSALLLLHRPSSSSEMAAARSLCDVQRSCDKVRAASQARDAFFSWVSHELRTPLNGIQSWSHILETYVNASSASPLAMRALQGIRTGVTQQLRLIEELLDISRVIEGKLPLSHHAFSLIPIVQSAVETVRHAAVARQISFSCHYSLKNDVIESDPCRLQQALQLLLSHAVERSPHRGHVHLSLQRQRDQACLRIVHGCSERNSSRQVAQTAAALRHRPSRHEMDLVLAHCLTELLEGCLETEPSAHGDIVHTLWLPLPANRRQDH